MQDALTEYTALTKMQGNAYMEEACLRAAGITFDNKDYENALTHFRHLQDVASNESNRCVAELGVLRCSANLGDQQSVVHIATEILSSSNIPDDMRQEALYCRAKAYLSQGNNGLAVVDLTPLAKETVTAIGAESKYLLAQAYLNMGALDDAEQEVMAFAQMNTQHPYWLAKAMLLLADISLQREDTYQAQQYLLALQANYHGNDDIQITIAQKLAALAVEEEQSEDVTTEPTEE